MRLEDQVCSLELAKRLKNLRIIQKSYAEWLYLPADDLWMVSPQFEATLGYAAFTVAELGEMLPFTLKDGHKWLFLTISKNGDKWKISYDQISGGEHTDAYFEQEDLNEANCRAQMLIYLLEHGLMKID